MKRLFAVYLMSMAFVSLVGAPVADAVESVVVTTHYPTINVGATSASIRGFVKNLSGREVVSWFEWGDSITMEKKTSPVVIQTSTRLKRITANVRNLEKGRSYYYRLIVQDEDRVIVGRTIHFKTDGTADISLPTIYPYELSAQPQTLPPIVVTNVPIEVSLTSARLQGSVLPRGDFYANGYFEWGITPGLGNVTPVRGLGSMLTMDFSEALSGLIPNTTYYYRAVGQTQFGSNWGATVRFVTNPVSNPSFYQYQSGTSAPVSSYVQPTVVSTPDSSSSVAVTLEEDSISGEGVTEVSYVQEEKADEENGGRSDQTGAVITTGDSYFPKSFLGWAALFALIAAFVGLLMYIVNLYRQMQEAHMKLERERAAQNPGRKLFS